VFVHHNTLEACENLSFQESLDAAHRATGARVRLPLAELRQMVADHRIEPAHLEACFDRVAPPEPAVALGLPTASHLAVGLLLHGRHASHWRIRAFQVAEGRPDPLVAHLDPKTRRYLAQAGRRALSAAPEALLTSLTGTTDPDERELRLHRQIGAGSLDELIQACHDSADRAAELGYARLVAIVLAGLPPRARKPSLASEQPVVDRAVDELVIPLVQAVLDQGQADWLPPSGTGLLSVGVRVLEGRYGVPLVATGAAELADLVAERLALDEEEAAEAVSRCVLLRPGWAGALLTADHHRRARVEELAALRFAATWLEAAERGLDARVLMKARGRSLAGPMERADRLAQALVRHCVDFDLLSELGSEQWSALEATVDGFTDASAATVLQEARDMTVRRRWLQALDAARRRNADRPTKPRVQVLACIDDREESFRRAIEELGGDEVETFGVAGHFGLALLWRGAGELHDSHRHPPALQATHRLVVPSPRRPAARRMLAGIQRFLDRDGLGPTGGLLAAATGLAIGPLLGLRVLFPRLGAWEEAPPSLRDGTPPVLVDAHPPDAHLPCAYTPEEAADVVGRLLRTIGLVDGFAPRVVVLGHGSTSLNNPHESAHDCGACGGFRGDANARVFAALANHPRVRAVLAQQGLVLPESTVFSGGMHDTASDRVTLHGTSGDAAWLDELLAASAARDALERGRRMDALPLSADEAGALAHVRGRSRDLSEVRPEYGHATNGLLVVGPRRSTRGLFLDRRALLHAYEPALDPDGSLLGGVLGAAVPVCAGINLEYYFSRVDNEVFGAGTKIPHNVTGLTGVMNGSLGDLRTGLPWQMVEIHEPTRLLVAVLAPRDRVWAVVEDLPRVRKMLAGGWIFLSVLDASGVANWSPTGFVPERVDDASLPHVESSVHWFARQADALAPALVGTS